MSRVWRFGITWDISSGLDANLRYDHGTSGTERMTTEYVLAIGDQSYDKGEGEIYPRTFSFSGSPDTQLIPKTPPPPPSKEW